MSLCKQKNGIWKIRLTHNGRRIQKSSGTRDKVAAQQLHDKWKADLWKTDKLKEKPERTWMDAVVRWLNESQHLKSLPDKKAQLRWVGQYLQNYKLHEITRDMIERVAESKEREGVKPATVNRLLEVIRAILRKAEREWGWLERAPFIRLRVVENKRIRWLTRKEAECLLQELPEHLSAMAAFSLATGLRESNVMQLPWSDVDLEKRHAWIHHDKAKAKRAIPVPLNSDAIAILNKQRGKHPEYVFVYQGHPVKQCNTKAWKKALKRAGIENFRWHDLRHTWASWHVQNGTTLQELQQLGSWSSFDMVLRYAHLNSDHLKDVAERISGPKLVYPFQPSNQALAVNA
jgi:integrase